MYFAHWPEIITLNLYELLPESIIITKSCTQGCISQSLYDINFFHFCTMHRTTSISQY
jgi:hypothetical protein